MASSLAWAQPTVPVAVLGVEASDGAPESVATAVTDAMRQKISSASGFRLVPGRDLVEVKLVFSCPDEAPSCMAQAAQSLGAEKLIFGSVKKAPGGSYLVTLKLLDAGKAKVEAYIAEQLTRNQATGPALRGPVQKWFADLTGRGATGVIRVTSDVLGASILLDGLPVGVTREEPVDLESIAAGPHEIVLSKPEHEPIKREVNVEAGKVAEVNVSMSPSAANQPTGPAGAGDDGIGGDDQTSGPDIDSGEGGGNRGLKFAAWSTAGVGVVTLVLGVKFGLDVQAANDDLDPYRRLECSQAASGFCDGRNEPVAPEDVMLTDDEEREVQQLRDDGDQAELLQYVFYGASAVLLGTSAYLFYAAYAADDEPEAVASRGRTRTAWPLVTPFAGPGVAGLRARLSF